MCNILKWSSCIIFGVVTFLITSPVHSRDKLTLWFGTGYADNHFLNERYVSGIFAVNYDIYRNFRFSFFHQSQLSNWTLDDTSDSNSFYLSYNYRVGNMTALVGSGVVDNGMFEAEYTAGILELNYVINNRFSINYVYNTSLDENNSINNYVYNMVYIAARFGP